MIDPNAPRTLHVTVSGRAGDNATVVRIIAKALMDNGIKLGVVGAEDYTNRSIGLQPNERERIKKAMTDVSVHLSTFRRE